MADWRNQSTAVPAAARPGGRGPGSVRPLPHSSLLPCLATRRECACRARPSACGGARARPAAGFSPAPRPAPAPAAGQGSPPAGRRRPSRRPSASGGARPEAGARRRRSRSIAAPGCARGRRPAPRARQRRPRRGRGPQGQPCGLVDDRLAFRGVRAAVAGTAASPPRAPLRERAWPPISERRGGACPGFARAWRGSPAQCL